jgi:hypothetical protein
MKKESKMQHNLAPLFLSSPHAIFNTGLLEKTDNGQTNGRVDREVPYKFRQPFESTKN